MRVKRKNAMSSADEQILRTAKEIVVKFIETGRVSPTTFHENFLSIYNTIETAVKGQTAAIVPAPEKASK